MFKIPFSGRPRPNRRKFNNGIVVTPPMTSEFWRRVLKGQFIWCEGWLLIAILCAIFGAILELKGFRWTDNWSVNFLGLALKNVTPGLSLMAVGIWAANRAAFNVTQQDPPPDPTPTPPPPQPWSFCAWLRKLLRRIFGRDRLHPRRITWGRLGVVVPAGAADKEFWEHAERYQWWVSVTGLIGGFICEVLGVLTVWLSNLSTPQWSATIAGIQIDNAPVGALLFLAGLALQEYTRYEVQAGQSGGTEDGRTKSGDAPKE